MIPTRNLLRLHRYAGLITAPLILFFAISGIWQVFRLHESRKMARTELHKRCK